jgi:hypothetical protein
MLAWLREGGGDFVEDNLSVAGHGGCGVKREVFYY